MTVTFPHPDKQGAGFRRNFSLRLKALSVFVFILSSGLFLHSSLLALSEMSGTTLKVTRSAVTRSGNRSASAGHALSSSGGELVSGLSASSSHKIYKGLWHIANYPGTVTTLVAASSNVANVVNLSWIAPGADGTIGTVSRYIVCYSTSGPIVTEADFSSATVFGNAWTPLPPSSPEVRSVTGLSLDTTYYFAVKASTGFADSVHGHCSTGTVFIRMDVTPPAQVTDLAAETGYSSGTIRLTWTNPGDDGTLGTAVRYIIKMASSAGQSPAFSDSNFDAAQDVSSTSPVPSPMPGATTVQFMIVTGLQENVSYYFAIKAEDESGNLGLLSNGATVQAQLTILSISFNINLYDFGSVPIGGTTQSMSAVVVTNDGNVPGTYQLRVATATPGVSPWTVAKNAAEGPGNDRFSLRAVFHGVKPSTGPVNNFAVNDVVTGSNQASTSTRFSVDGSQTGIAVPVSEQRDLWWYLLMPLTTSTTWQQRLNATVTTTLP